MNPLVAECLNNKLFAVCSSGLIHSVIFELSLLDILSRDDDISYDITYQSGITRECIYEHVFIANSSKHENFKDNYAFSSS